jgi:hypothetical protein
VHAIDSVDDQHPAMRPISGYELPTAPLGLGALTPGTGRAQRMAGRWALERKRTRHWQTRANFAGVAIVALIVALTFAIFRIAESSATLKGDELALTRLAGGSFDQVPFAPLKAFAPRAKVLYSKNGGWLYVVIEGDPGPLHLTVSEGGATRDLGAPLQRGRVATLFVTHAGKPENVTLHDATGPVAIAKLAH